MSLPDIAAIRLELAAAAPAGFTPYGWQAATVQTPAVVAGLPSRISLETAEIWRLELAMYVVIGGVYTPEAEAQLTAAALTVAQAYQGLKGTAFRVCTFDSISSFEAIQLGQVNGMAANVNLIVLT